MRALPVAVTLVGQARARKGNKDLGNRLADPAAGLSGRDAVLTIIGRQNARKLPDCGMPARGQVIDLAGARDAGIGTVILIRDHEYGEASQIPADCNPEVYDEGFWSRVDAWAGQFGLAGLGGIVLASEVPGTG